MEKVNIRNYRAIPILVLSILLLAGSSYFAVAKAEANSTPLAGQQLAYFIGYHYAPGYANGPHYYHYHHAVPRAVYWTRWRYVGHGCNRHCLVDRYTGRVVRCERVCHH